MFGFSRKPKRLRFPHGIPRVKNVGYDTDADFAVSAPNAPQAPGQQLPFAGSDALQVAISEVRDLHRPMAIYPLAEQKCFDDDHAVVEVEAGEWVCTCAPPEAHVCETCHDSDGDPRDYPCPTIAALNRHAPEEVNTDG